MKKITPLLLFILTCVLYSCEEVIELPLDTIDSRMVVEANLKITNPNTTNPQTIKLSETSSFYENQNEPIVDASVVVLNQQGTIFEFNHTQNGDYLCETFKGLTNESMTLQITYNNEVYSGNEVVMPLVEITSVENFEKEIPFSEKPLQAVRISFLDNINEKNSYFLQYKSTSFSNYEFIVSNDQFFNGNTHFFEIEESLENQPNTQTETINFSLFHCSSQHFDYMVKLIALIEDTGGPFSSIPTQAKGNIKNLTTPENKALGYFSINEISNGTTTLDLE